MFVWSNARMMAPRWTVTMTGTGTGRRISWIWLLLLLQLSLAENMLTTCYRKTSLNGITLTKGVPCGVVTPGGRHQNCCGYNNLCLEGGLCWFPNTFAGSQATHIYVGSCTDPTMTSPDCNLACSDMPIPDVVYNNTLQRWLCCGADSSGTRPTCSSPPLVERFTGPPQSLLRTTYVVSGSIPATAASWSDTYAGPSPTVQYVESGNTGASTSTAAPTTQSAAPAQSSTAASTPAAAPSTKDSTAASSTSPAQAGITSQSDASSSSTPKSSPKSTTAASTKSTSSSTSPSGTSSTTSGDGSHSSSTTSGTSTSSNGSQSKASTDSPSSGSSTTSVSDSQSSSNDVTATETSATGDATSTSDSDQSQVYPDNADQQTDTMDFSTTRLTLTNNGKTTQTTVTVSITKTPWVYGNNGTRSRTNSTTGTGDGSSASSPSISTAAKAGIAIGSCAGATLLLLAILWVCFRRRRTADGNRLSSGAQTTSSFGEKEPLPTRKPMAAVLRKHPARSWTTFKSPSSLGERTLLQNAGPMGFIYPYAETRTDNSEQRVVYNELPASLAGSSRVSRSESCRSGATASSRGTDSSRSTQSSIRGSLSSSSLSATMDFEGTIPVLLSPEEAGWGFLASNLPQQASLPSTDTSSAASTVYLNQERPLPQPPPSGISMLLEGSDDGRRFTRPPTYPGSPFEGKFASSTGAGRSSQDSQNRAVGGNGFPNEKTGSRTWQARRHSARSSAQRATPPRIPHASIASSQGTLGLGPGVIADGRGGRPPSDRTARSATAARPASPPYSLGLGTATTVTVTSEDHGRDRSMTVTSPRDTKSTLSSNSLLDSSFSATGLSAWPFHRHAGSFAEPASSPHFDGARISISQPLTSTPWRTKMRTIPPFMRTYGESEDGRWDGDGHGFESGAPAEIRASRATTMAEAPAINYEPPVADASAMPPVTLRPAVLPTYRSTVWNEVLHGEIQGGPWGQGPGAFV